MDPLTDQKDRLTVPVRCGSGYVRVLETTRTRKSFTDTKEPFTGDKNKPQKQNVNY